MDFEETKTGGNGHVAIHDWAPVDERGKHKDSDEIEQDISQTRHSMDIIMDALGGKFRPHQILDRFMDTLHKPENRERAKDAFTNLGSSLSRTFQQNPVPLLLIGAGTIWMILEQNRKQYPYDVRREDFERVPDDQYPASESTIGPARDKLESSMENFREKGQQIREKVSDTYKQQVTGIKDQAHKGYDSTNRFIHDNPFIVGAASLAFGIIAGALIPESHKEREVLGDTSRRVMDTARETGDEYLEKGRNIAGAAVETAESKAKEEVQTPPQSNTPAGKPERNPEDKSGLGGNIELQY
jgi:ElaB/YqjD/DUF883 family membrane-anchored ribosome-binding protein